MKDDNVVWHTFAGFDDEEKLAWGRKYQEQWPEGKGRYKLFRVKLRDYFDNASLFTAETVQSDKIDVYITRRGLYIKQLCVTSVLESDINIKVSNCQNAPARLDFVVAAKKGNVLKSTRELTSPNCSSRFVYNPEIASGVNAEFVNGYGCNSARASINTVDDNLFL